MHPLSVYGRSKAWGEELAGSANPRHFVVRTCGLYGSGANFVRTMLRLAGEREEVAVVDDQIVTPTSTAELARCLLALIRTGSYGIYHATCAGQCSWCEFAREIFALRGLQTRVRPITTAELNRPARRPPYSVLDNLMLRAAGLDSFQPWREALAEYLRLPAGGGAHGSV